MIYFDCASKMRSLKKGVLPMKSLKKGLSVLLSLVLCGSMVAPAFAATFSDLQDAISDTMSTDSGDSGGGSQGGTTDTSSGDSSSEPQGSTTGTDSSSHENGTVFQTDNGQERQGYAWNEQANDNTGWWGIEAWNDGDTRHVQLNENVERIDPTDPDASHTEPITVEENETVVIDTAGNDINGNKGAGNAIFNVSGNLTVNGQSEDGKIGTIQGGNNIYGNGGAINVGSDATVTLNDVKVTDNTAAGDGDGIYAAEGATVILTGKTEVSGNGTEDDDEDIYLDDGATLNGESLTAPEGTVWTDEAGKTTPVNSTVSSENGSHSLKWTPGSGSGNYGGGSTEVEITDPDVPLAEGPVSCAEFIHKMWVLDGEPAPLDDRGLPEGVDEDHEFAPAIAWAASADIVPVDGFDAEALLTVALAREYLTSFAAYADMAMPELVTLTGKDDDLVLNSDGVLDEFFGEKGSE